MGKGRATAYDPPVDSSSPAAAEHSAEVGGALIPRTAEISADIYQLIVREIPKVLEASVGENVATVLHVIQHGIDLENVRAPAAAQEYARRLAQRGMPVAALLRAYRIGSTRFQVWCLEELARRTDDASLISAAAMRIAGILAAYIDKVSEEMLFAYKTEKDSWLRNLSVARAARVRALLSGDRVDAGSSEAILGYRLRQHHVGAVAWITGAAADSNALSRLEQAAAEVAIQAQCSGRRRRDPVRHRCPGPRSGRFPRHPPAGAECPGGRAGRRAFKSARDQFRRGCPAGPHVGFGRTPAGLGHRDPRRAGRRRRPQRPAARHFGSLLAGKRQLQSHR